MGAKESFDSGNTKEYAKVCVYQYFVGERFKVDMFIEGLRNEFNNLEYEKKLPNVWRYCFGYTDTLEKSNKTDPIEIAEEIFVKYRKNADKYNNGKIAAARGLMLSQRIKSLLSDDKIDDFVRARIMALLHHAGIKSKFMSNMRRDIIKRSNDPRVLWILTGEGRFFKDDFNAKYWSWLLYDDESYESNLGEPEESSSFIEEI